MGLAWTKELSVENALIDSEHKKLIEMINGVELTIRERDCSAMSQAFRSLEDWLCVHFENEEKIARAINFDFSKHKPAQQYGLKELQHLRDELVMKDGLWSDGAVEHFAHFLKRWMIDEHIIKLNMLMKPMLQIHPYDFNPV